MKYEAERVGDRIFLISDTRVRGLNKEIPGASFSSVGGPHWSLPLDLPTCYALRRQFGRVLKIGPDLSSWAHETISRDTAMAALGEARDAELKRVPDVAPGLAAAMQNRQYQRVGARFVVEAVGSGGLLIADQPGLGKTLEAIGGIIESEIPGPYLVLCPKTAVGTVWSREIPRWWPGTTRKNTIVTTVPEGRVRRNVILDEFLLDDQFIKYQPDTWVVLHPEMIRVQSWWVCPECGGKTRYKAGPKKLDVADGKKSGCKREHDWVDPKDIKRLDEHEFPQLFDLEWGAIIADESDRMLLRRSGTMTQVRTGAELLRVRSDGVKIAMSGTPFRSRPHLLWGTLNWLRPKEYPAFWRWAEMFYEVTTDSGWGSSRSIGPMREDRQKILDQALRGIMLRRTKAEVAPDLPAKTYVGTPLVPGDERSPVGVWLPMAPAQQKLYDQMEASSMAVLAGGTLNAIGVLAEMTRLKQFATSAGRMVPGPEALKFEPVLPSNKLEYLVEYLEELGLPDDPETKVVIASQFTQVLNMFGRVLKDKFGPRQVTFVTGEVTGAKRNEAIDAFNQPTAPAISLHPERHPANPHVMLLQTKSGGVSITLDYAEHTFIVDETYTPDDQEQIEDRTHRVSRPRPVFYHYLRSLGTIEEDIAVVNMERARESHEVLDGRRGIEFARRVAEVTEARKCSR